MENPLQPKLVSGQTWGEFCEILKSAGNQILRPEAPPDAFTRAEGFRYLSRLLRIGLEMYVESGDADFPTFMVPSHETAKIGADNPDNYYQVARLNGMHDYRVSGNRGSVAFLNFSTKSGGYDANGKLELSGFIDAHGMQFDADGNFELILSQAPRPGNWLRLDAQTVQLLIRQTFLDRGTEKVAQIKIERIGAVGKPLPLDPVKLDDHLLKAAHFVANTATLFANWAKDYQTHSNQLPPADQALCQSVGGDPNIFFYHSLWELQEDEALIIEFDRIPQCDFWNFQINNYWMESLDYRYFNICINKHSAQYNDNGSLTVILAHINPGVPNWLETAGHTIGTMCLRWIGSTEQVHPTTRVVKLNEIKKDA